MEKKDQGLVEYALIIVLIAVVVVVLLAQLGPRFSNVFSNLSEQLSVNETNNIQPQIASLIIGGTLTDTTKVEVGIIAIQGIPKKIRVDKDMLVKAKLSPTDPTIKIISQQNDKNNWEVISASNIEIYPRMSAKMFGPSFQIQPSGSREYITDIGKPIEWVWTISPNETGENQVLNVEISIPVTITNPSKGTYEIEQAIADYSFIVQVVGKTGLSSQIEAIGSVLIKILGLGVVASILAGLGRSVINSIKSRHKHKVAKGKKLTKKNPDLEHPKNDTSP
jgi:pilus assembly protein Flp/PilA